MTVRQALERLESLRFTFGRGAAREKVALLGTLAEGALPDAEHVIRLHDVLAVLRAYPDDRPVLDLVNRLLARFHEREDTGRHRGELVNTGIAGTEIQFRFYWFTLGWLVRRWPDHVRIDWRSFGKRQRALLDGRLGMLMPYGESLAIEEAALTLKQWIDCLRGPEEGDAAFVVRRFDALRADPLPREIIFEEIDIPFRLTPGPDTPSLTHAYAPPSRIAFQHGPLAGSRGAFHAEIEREPLASCTVPRREARRLIELARTLMVARTRDLDCFVHASDDDVRIFDFSGGTQFVSFGSTPERRQMLDAAYGFLMLRNGVILGYVLSAALFESAEAAFNLSPPFRGAEAARLYGCALSVMRSLFGATTFVVDPYQMGYENAEGLRSGAWWFYYKLGFRPLDPVIARLAENEQRKVDKTPGFRSSPARLNRLASVNMYLHLGPPRADVIGEFSRDNVGLRIVRYLARRFGADRERGIETTGREAARLLGLGSLERLSAGERLAWDRWAPLVLLLPGIEAWPSVDRRTLARVVRAKGGRREAEFVRSFDRHPRLRQALLDLARPLEGPAAES